MRSVLYSIIATCCLVLFALQIASAQPPRFRGGPGENPDGLKDRRPDGQPRGHYSDRGGPRPDGPPPHRRSGRLNTGGPTADQIFHHIDRNRDGSISKEEFRRSFEERLRGRGGPSFGPTRFDGPPPRRPSQSGGPQHHQHGGPPNHGPRHHEKNASRDHGKQPPHKDGHHGHDHDQGHDSRYSRSNVHGHDHDRQAHHHDRDHHGDFHTRGHDHDRRDHARRRRGEEIKLRERGRGGRRNHGRGHGRRGHRDRKRR